MSERNHIYDLVDTKGFIKEALKLKEYLGVSQRNWNAHIVSEGGNPCTTVHKIWQLSVWACMYLKITFSVNLDLTTLEETELTKQG